MKKIETIRQKACAIQSHHPITKLALSLWVFAFLVPITTSALTAQTNNNPQNWQSPQVTQPQAQQNQSSSQGHIVPEPQKQQNPVGAGNGWQTEITKKNPNQPIDMDNETAEFVQKVSDYFNFITNLKGRFIQTNPENQQTYGTFYVQRPGKLRFDYAPPSKLRIISDGEFLSIEDPDVGSMERYPLESTPFKLLLAERVDLLNEAKILDISRGQDVAIITVSDKEDDSSGRLRLFFSIPELELKQWVITDPQGLDTRIQVSELVLDEQFSPDLFELGQEKVFESQ